MTPPSECSVRAVEVQHLHLSDKCEVMMRTSYENLDIITWINMRHRHIDTAIEAFIITVILHGAETAGRK